MHSTFQCVRYPGCKHGTCRQPNQCICDDGWGGHFCNEDLNYCTRHRPCKNSATCRNTGHGQYTCECLDGFTGTNCETRLENCSLQPCLNGATCIDVRGNNYTCICQWGYTGRYCQIRASSCSDNPCQNDAICTEIGPGSFLCNCRAGWRGTNCDIEIRPCDGIHCFNGGSIFFFDPVVTRFFLSTFTIQKQLMWSAGNTRKYMICSLSQFLMATG
ncbi:unnamed protein product [Gongylonema pulchrum]|uniref:Delta-like protein n=1 Tax=Gongylonema pulchrum TaxID=637853 RepID=A0A183DSH2_9BILA|nr:unnamed protein product [Gongylonema pulchrum]